MRRGFTLIELVVCIGIITLLVSVLLPVLGGAIEAGRRVGCQANLRTQGQALRMYLDAGDARLPFAAWPADASDGRLAPFDTLAEHLDAPAPRWDAEAGEGVRIDPWACPDDRVMTASTGVSYTYGPHQFFQMLGRDARAEVTRLHMAEGIAPVMLDGLPFHEGERNGLFGDGSVRLLTGG